MTTLLSIFACLYFVLENLRTQLQTARDLLDVSASNDQDKKKLKNLQKNTKQKFDMMNRYLKKLIHVKKDDEPEIPAHDVNEIISNQLNATMNVLWRRFARQPKGRNTLV